MPIQRTSAEVTLSVWKALLLRESLTRLFSSRAAWLWVVLEPAFHAGYLMVIFGAIQIRHIAGIDTMIWVAIGLLGFLLFRRTATQAQAGVDANRSLLAYRQVMPVDLVINRALLEGVLMLAIGAIVVLVLALLGYDIRPNDPLALMAAAFGLWALGFGFGLVASVAAELVPELGRLLKLLMMPLYLASGVMFPLQLVPLPYREWLMMNPVAHGLEASRHAMADHYHAVPEHSLPYLVFCALSLTLLGLALHRRFAQRLGSS